MVEKLLAKSVAAKLFQDDILSFTELQLVQFSRTPAEAAENLLDRLLLKQNKVGYDRFLEALKNTNQEHLFMWLTYNGE